MTSPEVVAHAAFSFVAQHIFAQIWGTERNVY